MKKLISLSIDYSTYKMLKERDNMSSYINNLIMKDYYETKEKNRLFKESKDSNFYKVKI